MGTLRLYIILNLVLATTMADFTSDCPQECRCVWAIGSKHADCTNANLYKNIQSLNLSGNALYEITRRAFQIVSLVNLKKLIMRECKLNTIHSNALSGLEIMIELDLSKNNLKTLHADTFNDTENIRWILLNDNQIEKLEDGLFNNLLRLQRVELSNNKIFQIGIKTFMNVPKLNHLKLDGNQLENLKIDTLSALTSLLNLDVHDNPWRCDCYLQPFRDWVISKNLYTSPTVCNEPPQVHGKLWKELNSSDFACRPTIVYPTTSITLISSEANITLPCQVNGNPLPEVNWEFHPQSSFKYKGKSKYFVSSSVNENSKWVNLTIVEAGITDNGDYLCIARNIGGLEERSLTLVIYG